MTNQAVHLGANIEIAYALRADVIVHVSEVSSGLACGCICARCGANLVARKGAIRCHHFAHYRDTECSGAAETLLHRLAKEILSKAAAIALPAYTYRATSPPRIAREILPPRRIPIDEAVVEHSLGVIIPDLAVFSGSDRLLIEIAVTHRVDRAKLRRVRRLNFPMLEIRLSPYDLLLPRPALTKRLVEDLANKSWLFHPAQRAVEAEWIRTRRKALKDARSLRRAKGVGSVTGHTALVSAAPLRLQGRPYWRRTNDWAEGFYRTQRRYPSLEETRVYERNKR